MYRDTSTVCWLSIARVCCRCLFSSVGCETAQRRSETNERTPIGGVDECVVVKVVGVSVGGWADVCDVTQWHSGRRVRGEGKET